MRTKIVVVGLMALAWGCAAGEGDEERAPEVERVEVGDTTIVRTLGPGVWRDTATLVEVGRIGVLEGPEEYQFGFVTEIAADREGGVYVFDAHGPALRYYDPSGTYVRTLGGEGEGPGEYQNAALGLVVRRSDGRVVMRDPRNMRLNVYEPDGTPSDSWRVESGLFTSDALVLGPDDHLYLKILTGRPEPNESWPIALLHVDDGGQIVDTLVPPTLPDEPTGPSGNLIPRKTWAFSPLGGFVVGVTDRYRIEHHRPDGTVLRIERDAVPVRVHPEEKAEREARNDWSRERQGQRMTSEIPPVPGVKPVYHSISAGEEGRIWVRRYTKAYKDESMEVPDPPDPDRPPPLTWRERHVYDVFDPDGTYLGVVEVPPRTTIAVRRGDRVWGIQRGEFNEASVVEFRIEVEDAG